MLKHTYQMGDQWSSNTQYAPTLTLTVAASDYTTIEQAKRELAHFLRRFATELERDNSGIPGWVREIME
jgi:hypothetical protein